MSGLFFFPQLYLFNLYSGRLTYGNIPVASVTHLSVIPAVADRGSPVNQARVYALPWAHVERLPGRPHAAQTQFHTQLYHLRLMILSVFLQDDEEGIWA